MQRRTGGCRCGAIRYAVSGGSFFCASCGVHVFSGPDSHPERVAVKVGSLDDPSDFHVQADIWMKSAPPWHTPHQGARQVAGNLS